MPESWTANEERQYQHAGRSSLSRGHSPTREVATSTMNAQSGDDGRMQMRRTMGTGNPRAPLEERTKDELYNLAEEHDIKGRSRMNKTQLITAIRRRQGSDL